MNPADHLSGDRILETVRRCNEQQLMIAELCDRHRKILTLSTRQAFGYGMITGGALMALVFVVAYFSGGAQWLKIQ